MKKLYFIRHGLSVMNQQGVFSGSIDTPLTDEGRKQAKQAGKLARDFGIDYIVSSPLARALETAQIIAGEIGYPTRDIHVNDLFVERHFGELEGKPWSPDLNLDGISDIETVDSLLERAKLALDWLHTLPADNILVVSHGSFGRALRRHILPEAIFEERIPNAQIVAWVER